MKIDSGDYVLDYDESSDKVQIIGSLRLNGLEEYAPVLDVLRECLTSTTAMTVDLSKLEFLNSSGIAMLSKFIIEARSKDDLSLTLLGSSKVPWQGKSLKNLQRLYPALKLIIE